jgi:ubiquinone/menaquinone biosynthesis C-methylase UbiE
MRKPRNGQRDVIMTYDRWADYDRDLSVVGYRGADLTIKFLRKFIASDAKILDVGCGTGLVGEALRKMGNSYTLVGTDLSQGMLDQAKAKHVYQKLVKANLRRPLPFKNNSFDAVMCIGVFEHFKTIRRELMDLARISKRYVAFYVLILPYLGYYHHAPERLLTALGHMNLAPLELFPFTAYHYALALGVIAEKVPVGGRDKHRRSVKIYPASPIDEPVTIVL